MDSKNEWLLLSVTLTEKLELVFVLTFENTFCYSFFLKPTERAQILLKSSTTDFQNSPLFEKLACFYVTFSESFKRFQYFNFGMSFWEKEPFSEKN